MNPTSQLTSLMDLVREFIRKAPHFEGDLKLARKIGERAADLMETLTDLEEVPSSSSHQPSTTE